MSNEQINNNGNNYIRDISLLLIGISWRVAFISGFNVLFNLHLKEIGFLEDSIGQITAMQSIILAVSIIPFGFFSDYLYKKNRNSRKWFVAIGVMVMSLGYFLMPWMNSFFLVMIFSGLAGFGKAIMLVGSAPLLQQCADHYKKLRRVIFLVSWIGIYIGTIGGSLLGGFLPGWLEGYFGTDSLAKATQILGAMTLLSSVPNFFVRIPKNDARTNTNFLKAKSTILIGSFAQFMQVLPIALISPFANIYFVHKIGVSTSDYGLVAASIPIVGIIITVLNIYLTQKMPRWVNAFLYAALALPAIYLMTFTEFFTVAISYALVQSFIENGMPMISGIQMSNIDPAKRGTIRSFGMFFGHLSRSIGSFAGGYIILYLSWDYLFYIATGLGVLTCLYYAIFLRKIELDTDKDKQPIILESFPHNYLRK